MNTYLYAYCDGQQCDIEKVVARNYEDCQNKIMSIYLNQCEDIDDTLSFDEFCDDLYYKYDILIGPIKEINEFL